ncbi:MAG: hypothetical protein HKN76_07215 [Saprospiraceae bacterium]|nr:hypothetical protein [Saprospiraceae bacterium]
MILFHNINGELVDANKARIMVHDLGLLRGYGIFDFFPVRDGKALFEEDYFNRFYRSADLMNLEVPVSRADLSERVRDLSVKNGITSGYVKLVLTGGNAIDGFTPGINNLYILQHPDIPQVADQYENGVILLFQRYLKDQPQIKTLNYSNALVHRHILQANNALDILYHDGRYIRETSRANFFIVDQENQIHTSLDYVLSGITRKHVISVIKAAGLIVQEAPLPIHRILNAAECFITSTTKGILPVIRIGTFQIGDGKAGEVSKALQKKYMAYCEVLVQKASNTIR